MADSPIPRDQFSLRRRDIINNPGALGAMSTIQMPDDYGNLDTWVVETYRLDGAETAFLQRNNAEGGIRVMLPPAVMAALRRQQATIDSRSRRRGARQAVATKIAEGQTIGNSEAFKNARRLKTSPDVSKRKFSRRHP